MTRKIELNGAIVFTDDTSIYDVYLLIIDEEEKTIECNDMNGFVIALIHYDDTEDCGFINYDGYGNILPYAEELVENGKLVI